jgi:hypothetical protein
MVLSMKTQDRIILFAATIAVFLGLFLFSGAFFAPLIRSFGFGGPSGTPFFLWGTASFLIGLCTILWIAKRKPPSR